MVKHVTKKRKFNTISVGKFYGAAKNGYQVGKQLVKGYRNGKRLFNTVSKAVRNRFKHRAGGSRTLTTASTNNAMLGVSQHNDWAKRPYRVIWVGKKKADYKTIGKFSLDHSYQVIASKSQGQQALAQLGVLFNRNQLSGTTSTLRADFADKWATDPFLLNPYSTPPNNAIYSAAAPGVASNDKIFIKYADHEMRFVSMETVAQRVKVMYFLCKKNTNRSITSLWQTILTSESYLQTTQAYASFIAIASITPGFTDVNQIGETPNTLKGFRNFFKLIDEDQFILQPGDQIQINRKFHFNKYVLKDTMTSMNTGDLYMPGISVVPMVFIDGALVGISIDVGTSAASEVAPAATRVGILQKDKYVFAAVPVNRFVIKRVETGYLRDDTTQFQKHIDDTDQAEALTSV